MVTEDNRLIEELQRSSDTNVFVMMRYRSATQFLEIEGAIQSTLAEFGMMARFAKDRTLLPGLWENIQLYMQFSRYGIAVFEEIDDKDFNPNISLELGFMYALNRRCLLLKDRRMPKMPTDISGQIYKDFDVFDLKTSVANQVRIWCERDLGIPRLGSWRPEKMVKEVIVFDSTSDDPQFSTWGLFSTVFAFEDHIQMSYSDSGSNPVLRLTADGNEHIGVNKYFEQLVGTIRFEYRAVRSDASNPNLLFCMIPMQDGKGRTQLLEVGARTPVEPANAYSPYRERYFIPHSEIGDERWHSAEIEFDFRDTPTAAYSIFAPRVNEGCPRPGGGEVLIRSVQLMTPLER